MKGLGWEKILPHIVAVAIFLIVATVYCKPALEGKVLQQHDVSQWKGAIQNSIDYSKNHNGKYPLWTNGLFSGMPAYQIGGIGGNIVAGYTYQLLTLGLPKPINFFFLASLCFYFLCMCLRIKPWVAIIGSLAFAYATYNPIIISVGHDTKMQAIALMPALLGSFILLFEKKYWPGFVLTALFTSLIISVNHLQITYYLFIALAVMSVFALVRFIKEKQFRHIAIVAALTLTAVGIGVLSNAEMLFSTYEYQKETIRGGGSVLTDSTSKSSGKGTGLDKNYAFAYSMGISESFVLMVPRMFGGSSDKEEVPQDKSKAIEALSSLPRELQQQLPMAYYWGGIKDVGGSTGTSGPPYTGVVICFLAILGFFILDGKQKWWLLTAVVLTLMMSWGGYLDGFNNFLFNNLPFYNKFRAPSMIMVIPQLLLPVMAVLCIDKIINVENKQSLQPLLIKGFIATGVAFALLLVLYFSFDFLSSTDKNILKQVKQMNQPQLTEAVNTFFTGLKEDRKTLMLNDIFRGLGFVIVTAAAIFLFIKNTFKPVVLCAITAILAFTDVILVGSTYLNKENYLEKEEEEATFIKTAQDEQILADKSDYRVYNLSSNCFNENNTSYWYKSIGGYHPAKLRIYQDLIEKQLGKQEPNTAVLNMLNVKYFIQKDGAGATQKFQKNDGAMGSCWLVKHLQFVKNADEEMKAIDNFNPRDTAFIQDTYKNTIPFLPEQDSSASIKLIKNDNDIITYEFSSTKNQFAVFSEVYYKSGWRAYVNGKELPIAKVNYVLRGLALAPGKYTIEFKFEPKGYLTGSMLTKILSVVQIALLIAGIFFIWKQNRLPATT